MVNKDKFEIEFALCNKHGETIVDEIKFTIPKSEITRYLTHQSDESELNEFYDDVVAKAFEELIHFVGGNREEFLEYAWKLLKDG